MGDGWREIGMTGRGCGQKKAKKNKDQGVVELGGEKNDMEWKDDKYEKLDVKSSKERKEGNGMGGWDKVRRKRKFSFNIILNTTLYQCAIQRPCTLS